MDNKRVVLTISRQFGAEGHEIGKVLSQRLGIKLYDKDILGRAARERGVDESAFSGADETVPKQFMEPYILLSMGVLNKADELFKIQSQIIRDIAATQSCIIVGRLSDYLLRDDPHCIKSYIYAPLEFRIENIRKKHGISESAAKKLVKQMDATRRGYCQYYSNGKWKPDKEKDIFLNREFFGVQGCADILEAAIRAKLAEF